MNVSSLLKYLQPLRDKDCTVYLETSYYYVPVEDIDVRNDIIILNTGHRPLSIKQLVKILFQYDDNTLAKIQYKTSLLDVLTIEVLYDMAVVIKAYKKIHGNCF